MNLNNKRDLTIWLNQQARKRRKTLSIPEQVRSILNKYGATMLLPGVSGVLRFGYQPGNYRESTGQTLAAADQQVGLVVDAARSPGPELAVTAAIGVSGGFVNNGDGSYTKPVGVDGTLAINGNAVPSGNYVRFRFEVVSISGTITPYVGGAIQSVITSVGPKEINAQSGASIITEASIYCSAANSVTVRLLSVRELPGIHASQSTSGFQPVLRNTAGIQSWQFDGTDDRLSLSAVPFQTQDVSFAIVAFMPLAADGGVGRRLFEFGGNGSEIALLTSNAGLLFNVRGDTGNQSSINGGATATNTPFVATCIQAGSSRSLRVDAVLKGSNAVIVSSSTANTATLGNRAAGDRPFNGHQHIQIFGKGAPSESELRSLERFAAQLQGRQL